MAINRKPKRQKAYAKPARKRKSRPQSKERKSSRKSPTRDIPGGSLADETDVDAVEVTGSQSAAEIMRVFQDSSFE